MADTSDYLRGILFIIAFLLTGIWDLKRWFMADLIFTCLSGVYIYINPSWSMNLQTTGIKIDDLHGHLNRVFAAFVIGPILMWLFCRKSSDKAVINAMLQSRTLSILLLLVVMGYGQLSYGKIFTDKHFWFGFLGNMLWWLANVIQLVKFDKEMQEPMVTRNAVISIISRVNLIFIMLGALTYLTAPEQMTDFVKNKKLDNYHIHTARAIGAIMTSLLVFSWNIPKFRFKKDIRFVFLSQIFAVILIVGSFSHLHFWSKIMNQKEYFSKIGMTLPLFLTPVVGLIATQYIEIHSVDDRPEDKKTQ